MRFLGVQKWCSTNVFFDTKQKHVCWKRDFLLENLKIKKKNSDNVHWNVWTNIKTLYARNNIFKKRITNMIFLIIYILVQNSFLGTALMHFSQCFMPWFSVGGQAWWRTSSLGPRPLPPTPHKKAYIKYMCRFLIRMILWHVSQHIWNETNIFFLKTFINLKRKTDAIYSKKDRSWRYNDKLIV